jgi:hypothetical protein
VLPNIERITSAAHRLREPSRPCLCRSGAVSR